MCKIIKAVIPWGWISSYQNSPSLIFFKAISSFFDTTSGTMNTDDHLFIYLSNCLSQTQPDGVFQNQINFRLIHSGPTPVPWLLAVRHQPNWWEVVNWKERRFLSIEGGHVTQAVVAPLTQKAIHLSTASCWEKAQPTFQRQKHPARISSLISKSNTVSFISTIHNASGRCQSK